MSIENKLVNCIIDHIYFDVICNYCETECCIFTGWKRHHGDTKDLSKNVRLNNTLTFCKDHYKNNAYYYKQKEERLAKGGWHTIYWQNHYNNIKFIPECEKYRASYEHLDNQLDNQFRIIIEGDADYNFNPNDKQFKTDIAKLRKYLKSKL